jgi:hypoxanthine phosphoribosyltransferase
MDILRISWEATVEYVEQLAGKVDFAPDMIVGLSRGGLVPARIMSDVLGVDDVGIVGMRFYKGMSRAGEFPVITQELTSDLSGKRILLVDDVADSGRSLMVAKDYLRRKGAAAIKVATIHYKPNSQFKPDYFVMTTSSWIAYPWEIHEIDRELQKLK